MHIPIKIHTRFRPKPTAEHVLAKVTEVMTDHLRQSRILFEASRIDAKQSTKFSELLNVSANEVYRQVKSGQLDSRNAVKYYIALVEHAREHILNLRPIGKRK
ncbi:MAG: hypothetical protein HOE11_04535 [Candidatus Diapherotrites archaeon]|jgi:hypothetical protein|nr:hypothetical protein [Candidatus Diapherotrites archaeon]MBT4596824.1 hypothetical protein [Candidatus Diapherotrites archaeon]